MWQHIIDGIVYQGLESSHPHQYWLMLVDQTSDTPV
jgi:hypothetical protein